MPSLLRCNARRGRLGETLAGIPKRPKTRINLPTRTVAWRLPDQVERTFIREVKNVKVVRLSNQLKDYMLEASDKGKKFILQVRKSTKVDPRIAEFASELDIDYELIKGLR